MPRHRLDAQDFLHTDPEDDMGAVDYEFDGPRERPGAIVMALVLVAAGALLYAVWWLIGDLVGMFGMTPMKEDERFMAGSPAITREIAVYLVAFFSAIAASALSAHLNWSWDGAMRFLAALTGA